MFHPFSGRLSYGNGRIACIFSYQNNFGGKDSDNSADIILTYSEDGTEVNLVCPWSTCHSLTQRVIFDGKYFYTASLGDSKPHNIKLVKFESDLPIHLDDYENENDNQHFREEYKKIILEKIEEENEKDENINNEDAKDDNKKSENSKNKNSAKNSNNNNESLSNKNNKKEESKNMEENKEKDNETYKENSRNSNLSDSLSEENDNENNKDINLQFYFPLQNKLINNTKILNLPSDESLKKVFQTKNFETFRQNYHLKLSIRHKFISKNIIDGCIPGNFSGKSSGRLGGFHLLPNNNLVLVYSRINCDNGYGNQNETSELCFLRLDSELKKVKAVPFRNGNFINIIKNARYGDNTFIMISETTKVTEDRKYISDKYTFYGEQIEEEHLPCNCFLVNENGELVSDLISFDFNFFSPNDDFQTLNDGTVVWTFVDDDNLLYLCFLALGNTSKFLKKCSEETMTAGKYNDFLIQKKEEEEEEKKRQEKEFLKSIGIDDDLIKKRLLESELIEKERIAKELEAKRLEDEARKAEEEKKKKEEEEKQGMMKEIEEEAKLREKLRLEEEEKKKQEEEKKKRKKNKGKGRDYSESDDEEEENEEDQQDEKLSNYYM